MPVPRYGEAAGRGEGLRLVARASAGCRMTDLWLCVAPAAGELFLDCGLPAILDKGADANPKDHGKAGRVDK